MKYPLMNNNITNQDINGLISFLKKKPILTQNKMVKKFENQWSKWLGVKYSVFVNSGSSANLLSLQLLKIKHPKGGEVIVPPLTWSSDIATILHCGFKPVFVDIDLNTLGMNTDGIIKKINKNTKAVFLSYIQGFNCLNTKLLNTLKKKKIPLIEDVCESHGATLKNKKLGTFGWTSNFSFYYAHHMSTIEGGMICTNDRLAYNNLLMLRSHGMIREMEDKSLQKKILKQNPSLNVKFIFQYAGYNVRNTEIGAVLGISQLKRLNSIVKQRTINLNLFLDNLDNNFFYKDFLLTGSSNYAFNVVLKNKNKKRFYKILKNLDKHGIEYRVGSAGGGNQLRQPYVKRLIKFKNFNNFKNVEHIHSYAFYIGNYPELLKKDILFITKVLNEGAK
jgi:CDP-6-deoxy-D-xylo-4-hexulose-3-dehydrase